MNTLIRAGIVALAFCSQAARAQEGIPPSLRAWQGWVLHGEEFRRCPFAASRQCTRQTHRLAPVSLRLAGRLTLAVDARGALLPALAVYSESWVQLPGDSETGRAKCGSTARPPRSWP
jgi:hypothetical protein